MKLTPLLSMLACLLFIACQQDNQTSQTGSTLGHVEFAVSGKDSAQPYFEKGLLLLHSFEYEDAVEAFLKAQELDPDMAMAYWGEAMAQNYPLWSQVNLDDARAALKKLGDTEEDRQSKAKTELEKEFLEAVEILYGEGDKLERDDAYAAYMASLHKKYPDNDEVSAFYALALLGSVDEGRDKEVYEEGARIAQKILDHNPEHPGALHYLIHSYDDPDHAHKAVYAADNYSKVAPDAGHALHMPSHIYIALGDWDDVVASNIASFDASKKRMEEKGLSNDALGYHAFHWLMYGYLQRGDNEDATRLIREMEEYTEGLESPRARSYRLMMEANYRTDTKNWAADAVQLDTDVDDLNISLQAVQAYVRGMMAFASDNLDLLEDIQADLSEKRKDAQDKVLQRGASMCSNVGWYKQLPTQVEVNQANVIELELQALADIKKGNVKAAERAFQMATELEASTSFMFGPPTIAKPSHEMYGDWLMLQGRSTDARVQYEKALERAPGRKLSVEGLQQTRVSTI